MSGITIPIILTVIAVITAFMAYRGVRRGGARFYTLERESMLRRASLTLVVSVIFFLSAIGLMIYNEQQELASDTGPTEEVETPVSEDTPEPSMQTQPPTPTPTATPDPNIPTATPTPIICRAIVEGTSGSGLTLRDAPAGNEIAVLADGSILTLLETEPEEANGFIWRNVRTVARDEGWVVEDFLTIGDCR